MSVEAAENQRPIKRYLRAYFSLRLNTHKVLDSATAILQAYEARELKLKENREKHKGCPDEDGFITVVSKSTAARMEEEDEMGFEDAANELLDPHHGTAKEKKKEGKRRLEETSEGKSLDFYKFQRKERKKNGIVDLRSKFEEDRQKLAALKSGALFKGQ